MADHRRTDLDRFYALLAELEERIGGRRRLGDTTGRQSWPQRGVYFFFERGERREDGRTPRVVRVGTHALRVGAASTLWGRLHQHRGTQARVEGGGNHRGSIFRLHVGEALAGRGDVPVLETWGDGSSAPQEVRAGEAPVEAAVSAVIGDMDVVWLAVEDDPGPSSLRGWIESNAIALLSNCGKASIDPPSAGWLGHHARAARIRESGLWNVNHVDERYDPAFVEDFEQLMRGQVPSMPRQRLDIDAEGNGSVTGDQREWLLDAIEELRVWRRGDERAPHKPLLVLLALGRLHHGGRFMAFSDIEQDLRSLLVDFGPPRHSYHPEFPFWYLRSDGIWEVPGDKTVAAEGAGSNPPISQMRQLHGGFPAPLWALLQGDPDLVREVAQRLLAAHFPASLHEDILDRVGLGDLAGAPLRRPDRRDPTFRLRVLRAYEYRCAVCGYDGRLDTIPVGLDAAHVRWWAADGPDELDNALALCVLHHKALDLGVLGITPGRRVQVSQAFHGGSRAEEFVVRFAGGLISAPQAGLPMLHERHRTWHEREVFRGPSRAAALAAEAGPPRPYRS